MRLAVLPIVLLLVLVLASAVGDIPISLENTVHILLFKLGLPSGAATWPAQDEIIVWDLRLPHVVAAALVGAGLAVAGTLFQSVLRNPLADPYVIGTAAGAQLGVTTSLLLPVQFALLGFGSMQTFAFAGAVGTVLLVYLLASIGGSARVVTLLLAGFVTSSFLISGTSFLLSISNRANDILSWTMGGINVSSWDQLKSTAPIVVAAVAVSWLMAPRLDVLLLGEESATHLGIHVERLKLGAVLVASLLTALAVTLAGIVAFVGLVVPHAARIFYGPGHRLLLPTSALGGAIFVVLADTLSRVLLAPTIIPLGSITALIGAPVFLYLLRRNRRDYSV
ncbi:MAG TPA: iron ABC transporter permease [Chloroflexota bacterium]